MHKDKWKFFAVLVGRQCLTQVRHAEKFPTGPDKQPWYTTYTMELGMKTATILSATDNNKGWGTLIIFWQHATPRKSWWQSRPECAYICSYIQLLLTFYLICSDNSSSPFSHAYVNYKFDHCVKLENEYVHMNM